MFWLQLLAVGATLYLVVGLVVAIVRMTAADMPWQFFVFAILLWPALWL